MTLVITSQNFEQEVKKSDIPVVIDMFAAWCGPCQQMTSAFDELAKEFEGKVKLAKINIDDERDLAIKFSVSSIPTFLFMKNGEVISKELGYMNKETLKSKIESLL